MTALLWCDKMYKNISKKLLHLTIEFFYSCEHISRIIKTNTGYTLKAYCQKVQMAEAARLLRTTELPVCQIAASMGYENRTQFYKVFRREYGLTPLEYRRHIAEE